MLKQLALYPVTLAGEWQDEPFDTSRLPATIMPNVTIERVKGLLRPDEFELYKDLLAKREMEALENLNSAILYRYDVRSEPESHQEAESVVRNVAACLMLIRPTTQRLGYMRGEIREDGSLRIQSFDNPWDEVNVPLIQRLFAVRTSDLLRLQKVAPAFVQAMNGEFWKFRVPVVSYESGHFSHRYWKGRFALWCSALDAIYSTQPEFDKPNPFEHSGSPVVKARVKGFLGGNTSIYAPGDVPYGEDLTPITVGEVLDDLYELRNSVVHGDRTPARFFEERRVIFGLSANLGEVLHEALSFIIRESLLKILEEDLLPHFANGPTSQAYFASRGWVKSKLPKLKRK